VGFIKRRMEKTRRGSARGKYGTERGGLIDIEKNHTGNLLLRRKLGEGTGRVAVKGVS